MDVSESNCHVNPYGYYCKTAARRFFRALRRFIDLNFFGRCGHHGHPYQ